MNKKLSAKFGEVIRELRKERNLSQEALADKADVHRTYIGMIERGEKNITLENIQRLAKALNVSLKSIFERLEKISK
ncbi:MAG: helix-turn-helix transcriptional regulator [Cytophagales bacterium]|nr:helix-turn-helix transcriptional regulator [Cytophagales bacterium]